MGKSAAKITEELKTELRSIIRQFDKLRALPKAEPVEVGGKTLYKFAGFGNYEAAYDEVIAFAGSVFQLKDPLHQYVKLMKLRTRDGKLSVEDEVAKSPALLIIGDLWNYKKHKHHDNRSKLTPILNVSFVFTGLKAMNHDGGSKDGQYFADTPDPSNAIRSATITSPQGLIGDAVDVIVCAFAHLIPMIRSMMFLTSERPDDMFIIRGMERIEADANVVIAYREAAQRPTV